MPVMKRYPTWATQFLAAFRETKSKTKAFDAVPTANRKMVAQLIENDEGFRFEIDEIVAARTDALEESMYQRALNGQKKGVWHKGYRVGEETVYPDPVAMFMLKGMAPEKYGDKKEINLNTKSRTVVVRVFDTQGNELSQKEAIDVTERDDPFPASGSIIDGITTSEE